MGMFEGYERHVKEVAAQEAALHDRYCIDLLKKHIPDIERQVIASSSFDALGSLLERQGYKVEHYVEPGTDGAEVHSYRLFKLVAASPKYQVKRVISVEEPNQTDTSS